MRYIAFLRGINVGGKNIKMEELKKAFSSLGFSNVTTILASGNVLFEATHASEVRIEDKLLHSFSSKTHVILRTADDIRKLMELDPFQGVKVTPQTRLYVTFLKAKPKSTLKIPYKSEDGEFRILKTTNTEAFSVLTLSAERGTTEVMSILEKEFGKEITTRNWNTIVKIGNTV